MGKFAVRVAAGFLVSIPFLIFLAGGVSNAAMLLLISIVCTAGIGLLGWIPVWWCLGWGTLVLLVRFGVLDVPTEQPKRPPKRSTQSTTHTTHRGKRSLAELAALKAYVERAVEDDMDVEEMTRRLQLNGWDPSEVQSIHYELMVSRSKGHEI